MARKVLLSGTRIGGHLHLAYVYYIYYEKGIRRDLSREELEDLIYEYFSRVKRKSPFVARIYGFPYENYALPYAEGALFSSVNDFVDWVIDQGFYIDEIADDWRKYIKKPFYLPGRDLFFEDYFLEVTLDDLDEWIEPFISFLERTGKLRKKRKAFDWRFKKFIMEQLALFLKERYGLLIIFIDDYAHRFGFEGYLYLKQDDFVKMLDKQYSREFNTFLRDLWDLINYEEV